MWPTCIGLATFGELKSRTMVRGERRLVEKEMIAASGRLQRLGQRRVLEPEIQEARARDLDWLAPFRNVELRDHVGGQLPRIHFPRFRQRHQRVALVVAELRVRTRPDENRRDVGIGKDGADGLLQSLFD